METVYCPVANRQVNGTMCLEIVNVADGMINERIFEDYSDDEKVIWNEAQRQKCLNCQWHADVED